MSSLEPLSCIVFSQALPAPSKVFFLFPFCSPSSYMEQLQMFCKELMYFFWTKSQKVFLHWSKRLWRLSILATGVHHTKKRKRNQTKNVYHVSAYIFPIVAPRSHCSSTFLKLKAFHSLSSSVIKSLQQPATRPPCHYLHLAERSSIRKNIKPLSHLSPNFSKDDYPRPLFLLRQGTWRDHLPTPIKYPQTDLLCPSRSPVIYGSATSSFLRKELVMGKTHPILETEFNLQTGA